MMLRLTRNTYQHGWIEHRPSKKQDLVFVYRWRERKSDGGYTKRSEVIGPVSMLKTEANAWRAIEHRKLDVNSDHPQGQAVTIGMLVSRYLETELPELRHSTANGYRSYLNHQIKPRWGEDRKSTRLNSSHGYISYAVFCLQKKNNVTNTQHT